MQKYQEKDKNVRLRHLCREESLEMKWPMPRRTIRQAKEECLAGCVQRMKHTSQTQVQFPIISHHGAGE